MHVYLKGKRHGLKPQQLLGTGGEADVYQLDDGRALKLFKQPGHPDFVQSREQQQAAELRIQEHQLKLPDFPVGLPSQVVVPEELALEGRKGPISGYAMRLVDGAEPIMRLGEKAFRDQGFSTQQVVRVFESLHTTLSGLHRSGVVVGDFNDLNILVKQDAAWVIDADSFQYGAYRCALFTERFVDPLHCDPAAHRPVLLRPHDPDSDWFAFQLMLFRSLFLVEPYGGVYRPRSAANKIPHAARSLHRITVFHPEVKFPRTARPPESLPDEVLSHFKRTFEDDQRGVFPLELIQKLRWQVCASCGVEFARKRCPACGLRSTVSVPIPTGLVAVERFKTDGFILHAEIDAAGELRTLSWKDGASIREDGQVVFRGEVEPKMKFRLLGEQTLLGMANQLLHFQGDRLESQAEVDVVDGLPAFDTNGRHCFRIQNGQLLRDEPLGAEYVGDVLAGQTRFWVGEVFGYGFYRAGLLTRAFVFDARTSGINDTVTPPPICGQLLDARCHLSKEFAWVCCTFQEQGRMRWSVQVIDRMGREVRVAVYDDLSQAPWLEGLSGAAAGGRQLLVPTDSGITRLDASLSQAQEIPGSARFVDLGSHLLKAGDGVCSANRSKVMLLRV